MLHNGLYEPIINKSLAVLFLVIGFYIANWIAQKAA